MISLAFLLGVALQAGGDPASWVRKLGSEDLGLREEATRRLMAFGDLAEPALTRGAESGDGEIAARAKEMLSYLNRTRKVRKLLAPGKPYTLRVSENVPRGVGDLLDDIGKHFGIRVEGAGLLADQMWTGTLEDLSFLRAIDRLAADAGFTYSVARGAVRFSEGKHIPYPADYPGSFKVMIQSASLTVGNSFNRVSSSANLMLTAVHQSGKVDPSPAAIQVDRVEFDTGEIVRLDPKKPSPDTFFGSPSARRVYIKKAPAGAKGIRSVRGNLEVRAPASLRTWRFERLEVGEKVREGSEIATIRAIDRGTYKNLNYVTLFIDINGKALKGEIMKGLRGSGSVRLLSKEGQNAPAPPSWPPRHVWGHHSETIEVEARFVLPAGTEFEPAKVSVQIAREFETMKVPFEIRGIRIRKE